MPSIEKFHRHWFKSKEHWLELRRSIGIGGSEIAGILGHDPYTPAPKVFYQKLGLVPPDPDNHAMFMGRLREPEIARIWQYYDRQVGQDSIRVNMDAGKVVRRNRLVNYLMQSRAYPWLFASCDRIFNEKGFGRSILEIKTIRGWEANKWETGIPTKYIFQVQHYLAVTGFKYAELFIETDGRDYQYVPIEPSRIIIQEIIDSGHEFQKRIDEARDRIAKGAKPEDIEDLVPGPDGTKAYTDFLKERYQRSSPDVVIKATDEELRLVRDFHLLRVEAEEKAAEFERIKQDLMNRMKHADKLDCGIYGYIGWKTNATGARPFNPRIKMDKLLEDTHGEVGTAPGFG
jgi:predicted phage-related endonuclease